jgi:hypothetical protein
MPVPRPTIGEFQKHYPSTDEMDRISLFKSIGWDRLLDNPAFNDTCAIRGSIGLIGCKVPLKGRVQILAGDHKGKWIEPGQHKLTIWLAHYWGQPDEKLATKDLRKLEGRHGIISHFNINPESPIAQGHFDVLDATPTELRRCASHCFWTAAETWFWELPSGKMRA